MDGERLPRVAQCDDALLPATSAILTPNTELKSMFLIEPERGCSRGCTYCVMRRSTNGDARLVPPDKGQGADSRRCDPRGPGRRRGDRSSQAATDPAPHRKERALQVGISSLRADRLTDEIVRPPRARRLPHPDRCQRWGR